VRRLLLASVAVMAALLLQLTLVDRLPTPGGPPDLVLLVTVALGLTCGPTTGLLTGFWAGLALDIAPPASALIGGRALVFCLIGYCCGLLRPLASRSALTTLGVAAVAAATGEALYAAAGLVLGSPGITWPAIRAVLPASVLLDVLISPFLVYLVLLAVASAHPAAESPLAGAAPAPARPRSPRGLIRPVSGRPLRLRPGPGEAGAGAAGGPGMPPPARSPRLRLSGATLPGGSAAGLRSAVTPTRRPASPIPARRLHVGRPAQRTAGHAAPGSAAALAGRPLPAPRTMAPRGLSARAFSSGRKTAIPPRRSVSPPSGLSARGLSSGKGPLPVSRRPVPPRGLSARALSSGKGPLPATRGLLPARGLSVRALTSGGSAARVLSPASPLGGLRVGRVPTRGFGARGLLPWPRRGKGFSGRVRAPRRFGFGGRVPARRLGFSKWRRLLPVWARGTTRQGSWRGSGPGGGAR
jgi:rod shape-determining protein MreD